jgi:hypothetical protein
MKTSSKTRIGPLAALAALGLLALPTVAQATTQQAPKGTALKAGAPFKMQTKTLRAWTEEEGEPGPSLICFHGELTGEVVTNGVEKPTNKINGSKFSNCIVSEPGGEEFNADVSTNAKENPWTLEFQQPKGTYFAHLLPATGNKLRIKVQVQIGGFDVATCVYASDSANPLTPFNFIGGENTNTLETIFSFFELQAGFPGFCGETMTTEATYEMTSGANAVFVDEK